jgi:hypothetical protein
MSTGEPNTLGAVHETADDLAQLQRLLDDSYARAGPHLLSIHTPNWRMSAERVCEVLTGMCLLTLATVNGAGHPIAGPVDGLFYRGRFWCGSAPNSIRASHIAKNPHVSATHTRGEELAVVVHGTAVTVDKTTDRALGFRDCAIEIYNEALIDEYWNGTAVYWEIEPRGMFALAPQIGEAGASSS